jgi:hypothetical protein
MISACKDGNPMLRSWIGDWIGTFLGQFVHPDLCVLVWSNVQVIREQYGRRNYRLTPRGQLPVVPISQRKS